jgi:hypothetical protein
MSSYRLLVSGKVVICCCPVLHELVIYSCSLSGESVADHSLGKEESGWKEVKNRDRREFFREIPDYGGGLWNGS